MCILKISWAVDASAGTSIGCGVDVSWGVVSWAWIKFMVEASRRLANKIANNTSFAFGFIFVSPSKFL